MQGEDQAGEGAASRVRDVSLGTRKPLDAAWPRRRAGAEPSHARKNLPTPRLGPGQGWGFTWEGARREPPPVRARVARPARPAPPAGVPTCPRGSAVGPAELQVGGPQSAGPRGGDRAPAPLHHVRRLIPGGLPGQGGRAGGRGRGPEAGGGPGKPDGVAGVLGWGDGERSGGGRDGGEAGGGGAPRWTLRSRRGRGACGAGHRGAGVRGGPGSPGSAQERAGRGGAGRVELEAGRRPTGLDGGVLSLLPPWRC